MKSVVEHHEGVAIVKVQGRIEIGEGDIQLRECLDHVSQEDNIHAIVLDFSKVSYIDSSGIGELVRAYSLLNRDGIELCITNLNPKLYDLMTLTRMVTVFAIFDSNEDAMQNLFKAA